MTSDCFLAHIQGYNRQGNFTNINSSSTSIPSTKVHAITWIEKQGKGESSNDEQTSSSAQVSCNGERKGTVGLVELISRQLGATSNCTT